MEKIWLQHYPEGVPADIDPDKYQSIRDLFEESVASFGERPAYYCMGKEITFSELDRLSRAFGAWLQAQGLHQGAAHQVFTAFAQAPEHVHMGKLQGVSPGGAVGFGQLRARG